MKNTPIGDGWYRVEKKKRNNVLLEEETNGLRADFRKALRQARLNKGLTKKQLAKALEEKESLIDAFENGRAPLTPELSKKISDVLDITLE